MTIKSFYFFAKKAFRMPILAFGLMVYLGFLAKTQAAVVWAVESGSVSGANSMQSVDLFQAQGESESYLFDIYLDTEGESVFGWDLTLLVGTVGQLGSVSGGELGVGGAVVGGYRQFGGDSLALTPLNDSSILLMSIQWSGVDSPGELALDSFSSVVDGNFNTSFLLGGTLANVAVAVPLPASIHLLVASVLPLVLSRRR